MIYQFGEMEFAPAALTLRFGEQRVVLEHRVAALLQYFCEHPSQPLTKRDIMEAVWADRVVNEDSLAVAVSKLRRHLRTLQPGCEPIHTLPGVGYQWSLRVTALRPETDAPASTSAGQDADNTTPKRRWPAVAVLSLVLSAVLLSVLYWPAAPVEQGDDGIMRAGALPDEVRARYHSAVDRIDQVQGYTGVESDYRGAIADLRAILEDYPDLVGAHAMIAEAKYNLAALSDYRDLHLYRDEIDTLARYVVERDPDNGHALELLAKLRFLGDWNMAEADAYYQRAMAAMPEDSALKLGYSEFLLSQGRFDQAEEVLAQLRRSDPSFFQYLNLSFVYMLRGEYERALAETQRLVQTEAPSEGHHRILMRIGVLSGDESLAWRHWQVLMREQGVDEQAIESMAQAYQQDGLAAVAAQLLDARIETNLGHHRPPIAYARYAVIAGRPDEAMRWLEQAVEQRQAHAQFLDVDPLYQPLRHRADFRALLSELDQGDEGVE